MDTARLEPRAVNRKHIDNRRRDVKRFSYFLISPAQRRVLYYIIHLLPPDRCLKSQISHLLTPPRTNSDQTRLISFLYQKKNFFFFHLSPTREKL